MLGKLDFFIIGYAAGTVVTLLLWVGTSWAYSHYNDYKLPSWWKK